MLCETRQRRRSVSLCSTRSRPSRVSAGAKRRRLSAMLANADVTPAQHLPRSPAGVGKVSARGRRVSGLKQVRGPCCPCVRLY